MKTKIMTVTPQWAEKQLKISAEMIENKTKKQRPISELKVDGMAQDIVRGHFGLTHQGIGFDVDGFCYDGRHRLSAIVKAKIPVKLQVSTGVPVEQGNNGVKILTMDMTDRGKPRSIATLLGLSHDLTSTTQWAATARSIACFCTGNKNGLTMAQTLEVLKIYQNNIGRIFSLTESARQMVAWICAPIAMLHATNPDVAETFAIKFFTLENLPSKSPILTFSKWHRNNGNRAGSNMVPCMKVVSSALYHHTMGNELTKIYSNNDAYEWLLGLDKSKVKKVREIMGV